MTTEYLRNTKFWGLNKLIKKIGRAIKSIIKERGKMDKTLTKISRNEKKKKLWNIKKKEMRNYEIKQIN
jgi:hypothetical protein